MNQFLSLCAEISKIVTVICIVERRKKSMSPRFVEIEKYGYHGKVT